MKRLRRIFSSGWTLVLKSCNQQQGKGVSDRNLLLYISFRAKSLMNMKSASPVSGGCVFLFCKCFLKEAFGVYNESGMYSLADHFFACPGLHSKHEHFAINLDQFRFSDDAASNRYRRIMGYRNGVFDRTLSFLKKMPDYLQGSYFHQRDHGRLRKGFQRAAAHGRGCVFMYNHSLCSAFQTGLQAYFIAPLITSARRCTPSIRRSSVALE